MSSIGKITGTVCRLTHNDGIKRLSLNKLRVQGGQLLYSIQRKSADIIPLFAETDDIPPLLKHFDAIRLQRIGTGVFIPIALII